MLILLIYKVIVITALRCERHKEPKEVISAKVLSKNVCYGRSSQNSFAGKALPCGSILPLNSKIITLNAKIIICQQQPPLYQ